MLRTPSTGSSKRSVVSKLQTRLGDLSLINMLNNAPSKGDELPPFHEYYIPVLHTFPVKPKQEFLCEEILYVSDERHESHYKKDHPNNQGKRLHIDLHIHHCSSVLPELILIIMACLGVEEAGKILADMTFLRTEGLIEPTIPKNGERGKKRYEVQFSLVIIVDGRNLRYEARYPMGE